MYQPLSQRVSIGFFILLAITTSGCSKDPERAKQEYLESGNRYFAEQKYNEAILQYRNALQQDAKFGPARLKLAEAHMRVGDSRGAFREYVRAADTLPDNVDAQIKAGSKMGLSIDSTSSGHVEDGERAPREQVFWLYCKRLLE